ncbi:hypothetical protein, partial [Klebsiella pneumoniae]|uniref:hypothetical protein n=1 Tax=Klebsiella pneumoniae TaxID=573 RepID=UPI003AF08943
DLILQLSKSSIYSTKPVYTYHIGYLLPSSAVLQHSAAKPALVRSTISSRSISAIIHSLFSLCSAVLSMK